MCISAHVCATIHVAVCTCQCVCVCLCVHVSVGGCACTCVRAFVSSVHMHVSVCACMYTCKDLLILHCDAFTSVGAHVGARVTRACVQPGVMGGERAPVMAWMACHAESAWVWDCHRACLHV